MATSRHDISLVVRYIQFLLLSTATLCCAAYTQVSKLTIPICVFRRLFLKCNFKLRTRTKNKTNILCVRVLCELSVPIFASIYDAVQINEGVCVGACVYEYVHLPLCGIHSVHTFFFVFFLCVWTKWKLTNSVSC